MRAINIITFKIISTYNLDSLEALSTILLWPNISHKLAVSISKSDAFLYAKTEACEH